MQKFKTIIFILILGAAITVLSNHFFRAQTDSLLEIGKNGGYGWPIAYNICSYPECYTHWQFSFLTFALDLLIWSAISCLGLFIIGKILKKDFFSIINLKTYHIIIAVLLSLLLIMGDTFIFKQHLVPKSLSGFDLDYSVCPVCKGGVQCAPCFGRLVIRYDYVLLNTLIYIPVFLLLIRLPSFIKKKTGRKTDTPPAQTVTPSTTQPPAAPPPSSTPPPPSPSPPPAA